MRGDRKGESNDSPEILDRRETSDIPGLPSGGARERKSEWVCACVHVCTCACVWMIEWAYPYVSLSTLGSYKMGRNKKIDHHYHHVRVNQPTNLRLQTGVLSSRQPAPSFDGLALRQDLLVLVGVGQSQQHPQRVVGMVHGHSLQDLQHTHEKVFVFFIGTGRSSSLSAQKGLLCQTPSSGLWHPSFNHCHI